MAKVQKNSLPWVPMYKNNSTIMISCQRYLSDALAIEVENLGYTLNSKFLTGVTIEGSLNDCIVLNLRLRTASSVMYLLNSFECQDPDQLYVRVKMMPWETLIRNDRELTIMSNVFHPSINNSMFANLRVKDGIVDRLIDKTGSRPNTSSEATGAVIYLYWKGDSAQIYYNTTGMSMARHGYRKIPGTAPMLESLAAATIYTTRWNPTRSFVNPMCGSGTVAIEAALMALEIPPSHFRSYYAFMSLPHYDPIFYKKLKNKITSERRTKIDAPIIASDISQRAIDNTLLNATAAEVSSYIQLECTSFENTSLPQSQKGVVFLNPEYGERLGDTDDLAKTYSDIGDFFKQKCSGYWGYVFTGNIPLSKKIGLRTKSKHTFYNSKIECKLLEYELYEGSKKKKNST